MLVKLVGGGIALAAFLLLATPKQHLFPAANHETRTDTGKSLPRHPQFAWTANQELEIASTGTVTPSTTATAIPPSTPTPIPTVVLPTQVSQPVEAGGPSQQVRLTFYYCQNDTPKRPGDGGGYCGNTGSGVPLTLGAAACPSAWDGRSFTVVNDPHGRVYTCLDHGALSANQVDIWFPYSSQGWTWQSVMGSSGMIIWQ